MNKTIGVRFPLKDIELLRMICKTRREDVSDFVRRAVQKELGQLNYLTSDEKKALGMRQ